MKLIELSKNSKNPLVKGKYSAMVDDGDYEWLNQFTWSVQFDTNTHYAVRATSRRLGKQKKIKMHREILGISDSKIKIDHIDHNGLNNQRCNIRYSTCSQNSMNKRKNKNASSKYMGVYLIRRKKCIRYGAFIQHNRISHSVGIFETEIEAAKARDIKAKELFGEFANLNFKSLD